MSPTSYQAAPPRDRWIKLVLFWGSVKVDCGLRSADHDDPDRTQSRMKSALRSPQSRFSKPIQQLLLPLHHPELLARDPLLRRRIGADGALAALQRIHQPRQRIDARLEPLPTRALP